ncbi:hypothetical protein [Methylobacterium sp. sgz302541]|uniref:hypothetical protein n=1 Tax=unclassified Methylobacterium TaxID=2615210 RepID=UPI003D35810E
MPQSAPSVPARKNLPRKHRLMLLAAFEILVVGFAQAKYPPWKPAILIEMSVTPNHVVT